MRALREPLTKLGFTNISALLAKAIIFGITAFFIYQFIGGGQMTEGLRVALAGISALVVAYVALFLFYLIKPPAPKRGDANFLISWKDAEVISGESYGLPLAESNMRWVKVGTYIETNYVTTIHSLVLSLKGEPYEAYGWEATTTQKMGPNPRYYHFQIPDGVDLTKHKAEIIAFTDEENYASVKFPIKQ